MAVILWGKPLITISNLEGAAITSRALTVPTPVINSTQLTTERGEKHEAQIEGGGNEAVRYDRGKHTLEFEVRFAKDRVMPLHDQCQDGIIKGSYKIEVADPDDNTAPKMTMADGVGSYEDILNADDGARRHYYFDSQVPTGGGDQIAWSNIGAVPSQ
jgi:hypothetical protein